MSGLNNIAMGFEASRRLPKPLQSMTPQEIRDAVQAVTEELESDEATFAAGHSHLDFQDLVKRRTNAKRAVASLAAGNAEAALRAVVAFWDGI
jgi:response regulator of citrate/malate metabolism